MRVYLYGFLAACVWAANASFAETLTLPDGRTVELKEDGTFAVIAGGPKDSVEAGLTAAELVALVDETPLEDIAKSRMNELLSASEQDRKLAEERLLARVKLIPAENNTGMPQVTQSCPNSTRKTASTRINMKSTHQYPPLTLGR